VTRSRGLGAWVALLLAVAPARLAAGPYDPTLEFRTLRTPHFVIHFHQGEAPAAARLAVIVERVHRALVPSLGHVPRGPTDVVLVSQDDLPNGQTTVVPWNAIEIVAVPPTGVELIGNTDDWLTYVFTHEYAHVLHLDRSLGWARAARAVFGRTEIAFRNLWLPLWQVEGFAVVAESQDGQGRLHAGDFREIVDAGVRAGRPEPIGRVNDGLVAWPAGLGWYAYGARFDEYLIERYGRDRFLELSDRTAGGLLLSRAFKSLYGESPGALWQAFEASLTASAPRGQFGGSKPERLTALGFRVAGPRVDADGSIWFSAADPHRFPGLYRLDLRGRLERKASRFGGSGLTLGRELVIFDQLELVRGAGLASDLYALDRRTGRVRRLTAQARLLDPDLSPDGRRLAAVRTGPARRELVVIDMVRLLASPRPVGDAALPVVARTGSSSDVYGASRWSPDGSQLAVERRRLGGPSTIVVLDAELTPARPTIYAPKGRAVTPEWVSDRSLLFASDADGGTFAIYRADWDAGGAALRVTRAASPLGGALWPTLGLDGRLVFVGYTTSGWDLFAMPLTMGPPADFSVEKPAPIVRQGVTGEDTEAVAAARPYSPWSTLAPRGWLPLAEQRDGRWRLGGQVVGRDVLARHAFAVSGSWAISSTAAAQGPAARPDWNASYAYQRWQAEPFVSVEDRTSLFEAVSGLGSLLPVAQREQRMDVGLWRPIRRVRWSQSLLAAYRAERLTTDASGMRQVARRNGLRGAWTVTTARRYGYSISQEGGIAAAVTGESFRPVLGADGVGEAVTGDVRAYLPAGWRHGVLAVRAAGAVSRGDPGVRRVFRLGGTTGNAALGVFGSDTISLIRGSGDTVVAGTHVALVNLEARVPLAWPQRGLGTWPAYLRSVYAAAFADIGNAWTTRWAWADRRTGVGAELSAVAAGFGLPLTWTVGVGWAHDGRGLVPDQRSVYFRLGPSF
jgi:hypothetical protein